MTGGALTGISVSISIISVFIALLIQQRKMAIAWGELTATLKDLKQYFDAEKALSLKRYTEICARVDKHDDILANHKTEIEILKVKGEKNGN